MLLNMNKISVFSSLHYEKLSTFKIWKKKIKYEQPKYSHGDKGHLTMISLSI